jgi:thiamine pyrophosphokinase
MSSHHIVRDEQEPAVLILDPAIATWDQVGPLMEWSPTLWVAEQALEKVLSWGIKVDGIFATPANVSGLLEKHFDQQPFKIFQLQPNESAFEMGMKLLSAANYTAVNVFCDITHPDTMSVFNGFSTKIQMVFFTLNTKYVFIKKNWEKWLPKGVKVAAWKPEGIRIDEIEKQIGLQFLREESTAQYLMFLTNNDGKIVLQGENPFWVLEFI